MNEIIEWYRQLDDKIKSLIKILLFLIVIIIVTVLFITYLYAPMMINGVSMNPSLRNGDVIIIDKTAYNDASPERFDIIAFKYRYDYSQRYIKRVIGLPGETIYISDNKIYIKKPGESDYQILKEYYGIYKGTPKLKDCEEILIGKDEYFVLGDNRYDSDDSRISSVGLVKSSTIIGKAVFRLLPFEGIGSLRYQ